MPVLTIIKYGLHKTVNYNTFDRNRSHLRLIEIFNASEAIKNTYTWLEMLSLFDPDSMLSLPVSFINVHEDREVVVRIYYKTAESTSIA